VNNYTRRNLLKTGATLGTVAVAGCSGSNDSSPNDTSQSPTDVEETKQRQTTIETTSRPDYSIYFSDNPVLSYDLTGVNPNDATEYTKQDVEEDFSAGLTATLEGGENSVTLEEFAHTTLEKTVENEDGEEETHVVYDGEGGMIPEYAVEAGETYTLTTQILPDQLPEDANLDEEERTVSTTVEVEKDLPENYFTEGIYTDTTNADLPEKYDALTDKQKTEKLRDTDAEILLQTQTETPFAYDTQVTEKQEFLEERLDTVYELAADEDLEEVLQEVPFTEQTMLDYINDDSHSQKQKKRGLAFYTNALAVETMRGSEYAERQAASQEKWMRQFIERHDVDFIDPDNIMMGGYDARGGGGHGQKIGDIDGDILHMETNVPETLWIDEMQGEALILDSGDLDPFHEYNEGTMPELDFDTKVSTQSNAIFSPAAVSSHMFDEPGGTLATDVYGRNAVENMLNHRYEDIARAEAITIHGRNENETEQVVIGDTEQPLILSTSNGFDDRIEHNPSLQTEEAIREEFAN
jgi:hypothetical protein